MGSEGAKSTEKTLVHTRRRLFSIALKIAAPASLAGWGMRSGHIGKLFQNPNEPRLRELIVKRCTSIFRFDGFNFWLRAFHFDLRLE